MQFALGLGADILIARPFNHAGPRQDEFYALSSFGAPGRRDRTRASGRIEVGNLDVVRDFTDVRDIVRAYRLLALKGQAGEIYNIGTGRNVKLSALLDILRSLGACRCPCTSIPRAAPDRPAALARRRLQAPRRHGLGAGRLDRANAGGYAGLLAAGDFRTPILTTHHPGVRKRTAELMPDEERELDAYLHVGHLLTIIKSKVRKGLKVL